MIGFVLLTITLFAATLAHGNSLIKMSSSKNRAVMGVLRTLGDLHLYFSDNLGDFQAKLTRCRVWATGTSN